MKLAMPLLTHTLEIRDECVAALVVENGNLFRRIIEELYEGAERDEGDCVLSKDGESLKMSERVELISSFVPFTINGKRLLTALLKRLEKMAYEPQMREKTESVLRTVQCFVRELVLDLPHAIECDDLAIATLLKGCSLTFEEEDLSLADKLIAYMRLGRELIGERVYVMVNLRSYMSFRELSGLLELCLLDHFSILLVDTKAGQMLPCEERLLVDNDFCEITRADDNMV